MKRKSFFLYILCFTMYLLCDSTSTLHRCFWANYQHFSGNVTHADDWYKKLLTSHNSGYSYKGYLSLLADTKQFASIVELMPKIGKKFSQDPDVQIIFVTALQETKQMKKADALVIELSQSFKTHPEISLLAAQAYLRRQEPENALLTINAYLNNTPRRPNNFIFYFLHSHIHTQLSQFPQALESIQKCLEMHPHFDKGWLLSASLYEKEGKIQEALSGYATFLELFGNNSQIEQHMLNLTLKYQSVGHHSAITPSGTRYKEKQARDLNAALILFKQKRYSQALAYVDACINGEPNNNECKLLKIQILSAMKNFNHAASALTAWITQTPEDSLWPKTLCLLAYNGMPHTAIIETFTTILKKQPDNLWCHLHCADMCMRAVQTDSAISHLENALPLIKDNVLGSKIAYQLALLHYDRNNYTSMLAWLEKAYAFNSQCPHINNTLAYYWATKGKNTLKAQSFIEKSLAAQSTNPYFLDTQAVILYKEKKYSQAHAILEKLENHNNGTMMLHLAKVHYALNNKENADTLTKKAQALVKNNHEKKALAKMQLLLAQT